MRQTPLLIKNTCSLLVFLFGLLLIAPAAIAYYEREGASSPVEENARDQKNEPSSKKQKPDYKQMYEESLNWFPNDTPPLIREFLKDPDNDELADMVRKYLDEVVRRANRAESKITGRTHSLVPQNTDIVSQLDSLAKRGYSVKYFYSDSCIYCQKSEPFIRAISRFLPVEKVSIRNKDEVVKWGVKETPTTFFINNGNANAYKMTGELNEETIADFISKLP